MRLRVSYWPKVAQETTWLMAMGNWSPSTQLLVIKFCNSYKWWKFKCFLITNAQLCWLSLFSPSLIRLTKPISPQFLFNIPFSFNQSVFHDACYLTVAFCINQLLFISGKQTLSVLTPIKFTEAEWDRKKKGNPLHLDTVMFIFGSMYKDTEET